MFVAGVVAEIVAGIVAGIFGQQRLVGNRFPARGLQRAVSQGIPAQVVHGWCGVFVAGFVAGFVAEVVAQIVGQQLGNSWATVGQQLGNNWATTVVLGWCQQPSS